MASKQVANFKWSEIEKHATREDGWIVIDDTIYDISKFYQQEIHPGGEVIFTHAGKDATDVFYAYHLQYVFKRKLVKYLVGIVADPRPPTPMEKEYRQMGKDIEVAGLYHGRPLWLSWKLFYPIAFVAAGIYLLGCGSNSTWVYLLGGALIGLGQHQAAFIGHDTCHVSTTLSFVTGLFYGSFIFGVSGIWWKYTHNQHHIVTNEYDRDPDITLLPLYAVSKCMFLSSSKGLKMTPGQEWRTRTIVGLQWATFFPVMGVIARILMMFQGISMLVSSVVPTMPWQPLHLASKWVWAERLTILAHIVGVVYLFGWYTPVGFRLEALAAQHIVCGFLHVQQTLSHWDRPTKHSSEEEDNWFVKQVVTGRNIEGDIFTEWFYGGLHFQIEHHIFPRVPRHNLRRLRDEYVRPFCEKWKIPYCSTGFWSAIYDVWSTLNDVAAHAGDKKLA